MPDPLISQFSRVFNSPIETNRQLATTTERNNIPSGVRWEGMIVYVVSEQTSYQLVGGVDNGSWELLGGLQDAPSDGQTYGRKDGNWELIPSGGVDWGDIGGTLANQTDLQTALDGKADLDGSNTFDNGTNTFNGVSVFGNAASFNGSSLFQGVTTIAGPLTFSPTGASYGTASDKGLIGMRNNGTYQFLNLGSGATNGVLDFRSLTVDRTFNFPDASGTLALQTAASGSFTTSDAKTVTVVNGIITSIV